MTDPPHASPGRLRRFGSFALALILVAAVFVIGVWIGGHPRQSGLDRTPAGIRDRLLEPERTTAGNQVLAILRDDYYRKLDPAMIAKMQNASAAGVVAAVGDPYTEYFTKDEYAKFLDTRSGTYVGVGIEWHPAGGRAIVVRVMPDGPAKKAGLRAGDAIVAVDGRKVQAKEPQAVMATVKGTAGTTVTLRIARAKAPERDYAITRAEIHELVTTSRVETVDGKKVGYVRLERFTTGSAKALRRDVEGLMEKRVSAVVLDLRGDPGGLLDEAEKVVGIFLGSGRPVATSRDRSGESEKLTSSGSKAIGDQPLVLLVDENSASASEVVSGALRDAKRAKLVGTRTFGKALIQTTHVLANGGALKYTVASYLTPDGFDLGHRGLTPDVAAKDDPSTPKDEGLQKALAVAVAS